MRLVGYIRVSRVAGREGDSFISPVQQRDRIQAHARAHQHTIVGWRDDLDQPGSRMDRPGLEQAIELIENGDADGLAVAKLDRFARSVSGAAKTLARIEHVGGVLVAVDLGMDTSTPAGKLMRNVLIALAEFELDRTRENWSDAQARAIGRGVHISRVPPFGYCRDEHARLIPDPDHGPLVRQVYELRAAGTSWRDIAMFLDERAPRASGNWPIQTVATLVKRRTYLGEAFKGDQVNAAAHEPLVDRDLWERAQVDAPKPLVFKGGSLLAGILRCAGCGYAMSRRSDGRRAQDYYRCRGRHAAGICADQALVAERLIDAHVTDQFLAFADGIAGTDSDLTVDSERAVAQLERAEAEVAAYRDANLVSVLGPRAYREGLEARAREVEAARMRLHEVRRASTSVRGVLDLVGEWPNLEVPERRELLAAAIDAVFVKRAHLPNGSGGLDGRVWICWRGEGPAGLPGRRSSGLVPFRFPGE